MNEAESISRGPHLLWNERGELKRSVRCSRVISFDLQGETTGVAAVMCYLEMNLLEILAGRDVCIAFP